LTGGFDLAAQWMGWENIFHCEWNEFGQKVLKYYWPNSISYGDITKTDFTIHRGSVDVLTGGFPCQPFSMAGKRKGTEDERHLWPEMLRAISEIQPAWVVGENVPGLINWSKGMVFEQVQTDLETQGYEVIPFILPACGVNAPHRRDRIWIIAYSGSCNGSLSIQQRGQNKAKDINAYREDANGITSNTPNIRQEQSGSSWERWAGFENGNTLLYVTDTNINLGCERGMHQARPEKTERHIGTFNSREDGRTWQNFPTQSPVRNGNDGISSRLDSITFPKWRNESIKAGGNAIVPAVAYQIFKAIQNFNDQQSS
jgi:DNA (cytosine-5)-methyltransferase 1